jgi:hypothetical protein
MIVITDKHHQAISYYLKLEKKVYTMENVLVEFRINMIYIILFKYNIK